MLPFGTLTGKIGGVWECTAFGNPARQAAARASAEHLSRDMEISFSIKQKVDN